MRVRIVADDGHHILLHSPAGYQMERAILILERIQRARLVRVEEDFEVEDIGEEQAR